MMTNREWRRPWQTGIALAMLTLYPCAAHAEPIDFTTFSVDWFPQTNGPLAEWITTPNEARIDDAPADMGGTPNASVNVFYGTQNVHNKRIVGTLTPGTDDDPIGFVVGWRPGDADYFNFPDVLDADYLLLDWKGVTQTFDFSDSVDSGLLFNDQTPGGEMPVGLALSRVSGIPTADELWQHADLPENPEGGVEELARAATLGSTPYPRDNSSVLVDIRYSPTNITVLVDGVEQFNEDGSFPDGRFGLYSLNQGPTAVWSDFELFDLVDPLTATIDRDTSEIELFNPTGSAFSFEGYSILSDEGGLNPDGWTSITENYDEGGDIDEDAWAITSSTRFDLREAEESAGDGGSLAAGASISLGAAWTRSPFEDLRMELVSAEGDLVPVDIEFVNGPGGGSFARSDLNADGVIDAADWPLFYENTLTDLSGLSPVQQYLRGDLDGDGDNDVEDFGIFKSDFDMANGAGAFAAMTAVPEPSTLAMLGMCLVGAFVASRRRLAGLVHRSAPGAAVALLILGSASAAFAAPLDFTTFTVENYPHTDSNDDPATDFFPLADWSGSTPTMATHNANSNPSVFYSTETALNKVITGTLTPGTDDDMVGFVLGFQPGNATLGDPSIETADYLLIDWKGAGQTFNWTDFADTGNEFHDLTPGTPAPGGLALSRVTGLPTADELWGHVDFEENPQGGVTQLARGATLGSSAYPRDDTSVDFEIRYTANYVTVKVDGVRQFAEIGNFGEGRFGLYTAGQGPPPIYSDFEIFDVGELDLLKAVVHRDTGMIELTNESDSSIDFDYYHLSSPTQSLNIGSWNSLSDQEFQAVGSGEGENWAEAGGSSNSELAELFLLSTSTLASDASVGLGNAYNSQINGEDIVLTYRLPDGSLEFGIVEYIGEPTVGGISGDFNNNGLVEQQDLDLVLANWGDPAASAPPTWSNDPPEGNIDQTELDKVLVNWGNTASLGTAAGVPEPSSLILLALSALALLAMRRR